jgi:hypothetical protein
VVSKNREAVRRDGQWDPNLDAYRVVDPTDGSATYYVWKKPDMFFEAIVMTGMFLFWVGLAAVVFVCFFPWPEGVAGDREAQLADALTDRYRVDVSYLPQSWTSGQVFTVDIEQDWDDPDYDEPALTKRACKLQPGETADDLSLQCPTMFGAYEEVREGGGDSGHHRQAKNLLEQTPATPRFQSPGSDDSSDQYAPDPYEDHEPDPYDYYEPEEMYP